MSMTLMVRAMNLKIGNPLRKLVLIKLADNANDKGECWPSYQHIADQCEISKSSVKTHIKALVEIGILSYQHREGPKGNTSNMYQLSLNGGSTANPGGSGAAIGGSGAAIGGSGDNPGGGSGADTRTSHSFEPVIEPVTHTTKRFVQPNQDKVSEYMASRSAKGWTKPNQQAQEFIDYYQAKGWMVGKNKMKDWKAAVRTWEKNLVTYSAPFDLIAESYTRHLSPKTHCYPELLSDQVKQHIQKRWDKNPDISNWSKFFAAVRNKIEYSDKQFIGHKYNFDKLMTWNFEEVYNEINRGVG